MLRLCHYPHFQSAIQRTGAEFTANREGNVAICFAIALIPILCFVGATIDYGRAAAARTVMQGALDSTALMLSKDLSSGLITTAQINATAQSYFSAMYTNRDAHSVVVSATYTAAGSSNGATVQVSGSGSITADFLGIVGFPQLSFNASSTAAWGGSPLRVALVLDNTGSMSDFDKIGALQSAAQLLVKQLSSLAATDSDVYISVVPFEVDVNVGTANVNASWLRWDLWDPKNQPNWAWSSSQTYCDGGNWLTYAQCVGHGYNWDHQPKTSNLGRWNGCVTDRDQDHDVDSTAPSSYSTSFVADQDLSCPSAQILPLTNDWSAITNTINSMTPNGATNQTIGLQWGWLSLLQQPPLNAPMEAPNVSYQHIIVLFTDGLNTGNRWYGDFQDTSSQVDSRMRVLCDNIKATGVTIYTVQIDTDGAGQSDVLPYCASSSSDFFMLTQPSQIASAFAQIGTSISRLRLSK